MKLLSRKSIIGAISVVVVAAVFVGCTGGVTARGWSGVTRTGDTVLCVSMAGAAYAVDATSGVSTGAPAKLVVPASGGLLGCVPSCGGAQTTPIAIYASPAVGGDLVIIAGMDGKVRAYDLKDGKIGTDWKFIFPREGNIAAIVGGLVVENGHVYFGSTDGTVYSLNASDLSKEWSHAIGEKIWSAPALSGNTIYIGTFDRKLYALSATDGTPLWNFVAGGAISTTPVVQGGLVYFGSYDRKFYAVDATTGTGSWTFPATTGEDKAPADWFWAQAVVSGNNIFAPNMDGKVYQLDAKTGAFLKFIDLLKPVSSAPVLIGDKLIVAATDLVKKMSVVYAIDINSGSSRDLASLTEGIDAPLSASGDTVYLHTTRDNFYGLNSQNGALQKFSLTK